MDIEALVKLAGEAKGRAEKATPSTVDVPWEVRKNRNDESEIHAGDEWIAILPHQCVTAIEEHRAHDAAFLCASRTDVPALADGVIDLARENDRLRRIIMREAEPTFGPLRQQPDGKIALEVHDPMQIGQVIGGHFAEMLTAAGAGNYAEMTFRAGADSAENIVVTVQRFGKLTPHAARVQAERHLERAVGLLREHGIEWDGPTEFLPEPPPDREHDDDWPVIDASSVPNALVCRRCGGRQDLPERQTADILQAMCDAFAARHARGGCGGNGGGGAAGTLARAPGPWSRRRGGGGSGWRMVAMSTLAVLSSARDLIADPARWLQDGGGFTACDAAGNGLAAWSDGAVRWDLLGAIERVSASLGEHYWQCRNLEWETHGLLCRTLGILAPRPEHSSSYLHEWHDTTGRTHAEVMQALDAAIALANLECAT